MRYVSEQFKEALGELVRPATRMYFEIRRDAPISHGSGTRDATYLNLDASVAPVVTPELCVNENFYAILGDDVGVDEPCRICAPDDPTPDIVPDSVTIPFGVTFLTAANNYAMIGDNTSPGYNFVIGIDPDDTSIQPEVTFCFKGGHIPTVLQVQRYDEDSDTWVTEENIGNHDHEEKIVWQLEPNHFDEDGLMYFRIRVKNSDAAGRFQLNYVESKSIGIHGDNSAIFENSLISSVDISLETDLTSQTLPSYSMTVECLDVDEIYKPDTRYWKEVFVEGAYCFFKLGYEFEGGEELIPFFCGSLEKAPDYTGGKITFNVEVNAFKQDVDNDLTINSHPNKTLNTGDEVDSITFYDMLNPSEHYLPLFDECDVFRNAGDISSSKTNYSGKVGWNELRQLVANALGCYIKTLADGRKLGIYNTVDVQYKPFDDYMTRYEQIQSTLESQPRVGSIAVTRNSNTVSNDSVQKTLADRIYVHADEYVSATYNIPFFSISKFIVNDYQKSVPSAVVAADYSTANLQEVKPDGTVDVNITFTSDTNTYLQPIVTFYGVKNEKFTETDEDYHGGVGEKYENNNDLVTNAYVANKVKQVARMINDIQNKYEVDVVQDYRYELGDIIRLETQKNTFKTCVITGLNFKLPGSSGHLTCRKIFSLLDSSFAVIGAEGLTISCDGELFTITKTSESGVVVGKCESADYTYVYMLGVSRYSAYGSEHPSNADLIDLNGHFWNFVLLRFEVGASIVTNAPVIELVYESSLSVDEATYGAVNMIKKIYEDQGMTAPVDYTCILD